MTVAAATPYWSATAPTASSTPAAAAGRILVVGVTSVQPAVDWGVVTD